ncbi:LytTR family DNA-binding domain-containing protein [Actimicrobium antarcticum]|uniref:LytTR family DNA-binding domain-containing protein n=1 Tax=Actimicrobium antarcticum TaxID=1051899 RepID=A0ABP7T698_9BURK
MATAILADDEPHMRASLRDQLGEFWPELEIVGEAADGPAALSLIERCRPALAFLDIRMPGLTGLKVAQAMTAQTRVVFVTAYEAHAVSAFEVNAIDFVLKPVDPARLARVVTKLRNATLPMTADPAALHAAFAALGLAGPIADTSASNALASAARLSWLQVGVGHEVRMVHINDVIFFESDTKYTRVVAADCDGLIRLSLRQLLDQIDAMTFLQTHRSTVVNRRFIKAVHRQNDLMEIVLRGHPARLKVSLPNHHFFRAM